MQTTQQDAKCRPDFASGWLHVDSGIINPYWLSPVHHWRGPPPRIHRKALSIQGQQHPPPARADRMPRLYCQGIRSASAKSARISLRGRSAGVRSPNILRLMAPGSCCFNKYRGGVCPCQIPQEARGAPQGCRAQCCKAGVRGLQKW